MERRKGTVLHYGLRSVRGLAVTGYLGIDPGLNGAIVFHGPGATHIFDVPTVKRKVNGRTKSQIEPYAAARFIDMIRPDVKCAIIEQVNAMPAQGVTSSFNFGYVAGCMLGLVAANLIPIHTVTPAVWKRHFGLIGQDKDASRSAASRLAPNLSQHWALAKHDGRAEAFLLAVYGSKVIT